LVVKGVVRRIDRDFCDHVGARDNHLLAGLLAADYGRLKPSLESVSLSPGTMLYESGVPHSHVIFPADSIIALVHVLRDGHSAEIAAVGSEGFVGVPVVTGDGKSSSRAVVQSPGRAYRMRVGLFMREFERNTRLRNLILRYTQALMTQIAQTLVCNRYHLIEQQLCRWLLLRLDRSSTNVICVTQELIANMLGVRREGITAAACSLKTAGVIEYRRGHIVVADRRSLEAQVCECYSVVRSEYDRLLPQRIADAGVSANDRVARSAESRHIISVPSAAPSCAAS
jgi:CRP-like cAMP-binding protein